MEEVSQCMQFCRKNCKGGEERDLYTLIENSASQILAGPLNGSHICLVGS